MFSPKFLVNANEASKNVDVINENFRNIKVDLEYLNDLDKRISDIDARTKCVNPERIRRDYLSTKSELNGKLYGSISGGRIPQKDHLNSNKLKDTSWEAYYEHLQPVNDNESDVGQSLKRVKTAYAYVVNALTGIYRAGLELASVFAPISHASNSTTFGIADASNYGHVKSSTTNPLMDGVADPGTAGAMVANYNHRHPSDTSKKDNLVYEWTRGAITGEGWAKLLSLTLPNSTTTNCGWVFRVLIGGTSAGTSSQVGVLRIQWRNGTLNAAFSKTTGTNTFKFGYKGSLAINSLFEVYAYCDAYPYALIEVEYSYGGVIAGGKFSTTNPTMTDILSETICDKLVVSDSATISDIKLALTGIDTTSFTTKSTGTTNLTAGNLYAWIPSGAGQTFTIGSINMAKSDIAVVALNLSGFGCIITYPDITGNTTSRTLSSATGYKPTLIFLRAGSGFTVVGI